MDKDAYGWRLLALLVVGSVAKALFQPRYYSQPTAVTPATPEKAEDES